MYLLILVIDFFKGSFFLGAEQNKYFIIRSVNKAWRISLGINLRIARMTGKMFCFIFLGIICILDLSKMSWVLKCSVLSVHDTTGHPR